MSTRGIAGPKTGKSAGLRRGKRDQLWMTGPMGALGKEHVDEHMLGLLRASHGI
jgi:hypothetical protein